MVKKKSKKTSKSTLSKLAKTGKKVLGMKGDGTGKRRKKSAQWYAKEILRLRLKKKLEKIKLGGFR